jgi:hypothetical protein
MQQSYGLRKSDLVIQLGEPNYITAMCAAIAVKQVSTGVRKKTGMVVGVERAQSHEPAVSDAPRRLPSLRAQVIEQWNLLFQFIDRASIHELFAS